MSDNCLAPLLTAAALFGALPRECAAQGLPRGDSRALGFAPERLADIDTLLDEAVTSRKLAGASAMIVRRGQVAYLGFAGRQDIDTNRPLDAATIFRIASMTKPITTVAAMMLVEQGQLRLGDPVSKFFPEFASPRVLVPQDANGAPYRLVPAEHEITIRHLLTHTSGLSLYGLTPALIDIYQKENISNGLVETPGTAADNVRRLARAPLLFQPGAGWEYGLNTDVLGCIVEVVSGQSLDEFFRQRIFDPLKMGDTHFIVPASKRDRLAALYTPIADKSIRRVEREPVRGGEKGEKVVSATYSTNDASRYYSGGAGLCSTIGDYARFLQMLAAGGALDGVRLLKPETIAEMTMNHVGNLPLRIADHGDGFGYGFAIVTDRRPVVADRPSVGSYSWGGAFYTHFWVDPQQELFGILMTQIWPWPYENPGLRQEFEKQTYRALETR